ncbi:hypothetical protein [Flagellimonas sp.]|uniref:hypothetical protein n=1 Tax=Flagellimonas sp. TaxID=2058762 RepID=UPI003F4A08A5
MKRIRWSYLFSGLLVLVSCSSDLEEEDQISEDFMLNISFVMDASAERLDNLGEAVGIPAGNAAQNPDFEVLGLHFIGLYPDKFTPFENGTTVFSSPTTNQGGLEAIDFENELFLTESDNKISIPLSDVSPGTYEFFRASIGFQQYKIVYNLAGLSIQHTSWPKGVADDIDVEGTVASFLGFNTYINQYFLGNQTITVDSNKLQGYFGLETSGEISGFPFNHLTEGESNRTTVPNPINETSPIPPGSCVVTGKFQSALVVPEKPVRDIDVQIVISVNMSFEWKDTNGNGKFEPLLGEKVMDMGTRGVFPTVL